MTLKVVVLQSQEQLITDLKEIVSEEKVVAYLLSNPHRLDVSTFTKETSVEVTLSPWILASAEKEIPVPSHHVVTIVEPLESIKEMYLEKTNGTRTESDQTDSSDARTESDK